MPCNCDGYPEPEPDLHNGPLAEMLCAALAVHEARGEMSCFSAKQLAWWKEHKKRDEARIQLDAQRAQVEADREAARGRLAAAITTLSDYDRKLLGL